MVTQQQPEKQDDFDVLMHGQDVSAYAEKCPNCGADLTFDAEAQMLACAFCNSRIPFEMSRAEEQCFTQLFQKPNEWAAEAAVIQCESCGAKTVISKDELSKSCAFCGTNKVVDSAEISGHRPNAVLPFKLSFQQASERARLWAKKKLFAPKAFKKCASPEDLKGLYSPAFTFSTATRSRYHGRFGRRVMVTRRINGRLTTVSEMRWFPVNGFIDRWFDEILIQSSSTIGNRTMAKLGAFDTKSSKKFASEFLRGYAAEQYARDGIQCWGDAKSQIEKQIRQEIIRRYQADQVQFLNISTGYGQIRHKYVLLPVYVGHFSYKQKLYNFFVNGFSGKVFGKTPKNPVKVAGAVVLGLALLAGIGFLAYLFMMGGG